MIFEIASQLNRGTVLITSREEREAVAELNLMAGKRAKTSTAYASALNYLIVGAALLADDRWERRHELAFALELNRAECEFLTGELAAAEERLTALSPLAANTLEQATVACMLVDVYTALDKPDWAVAVCLDYLRRLGVEWSPHPTAEEAQREYEQIWSQLGHRAIEDLLELPLMSDPESLATLDVLTKALPPAMITDANLLSLAVCRAVNLSLTHGNSDGSCFAYVFLGMIAGPHFDNYERGFQFGQLGYALVEKRSLHRHRARTYIAFGSFVMPWSRHVKAGRDLVRRAFEAANKIGDLTYAAYSCNNMNTKLLAAGDSLVEVQREAENGLEFAQKARFGLVIDIITSQLKLIRTLRGLTPKFGFFDDGLFDELRFERHLATYPALALPECWYWIRKLQARVFAEDYPSAIEASLNAERLLWTSPSFFEVAEYHFYSALARAGAFDSATEDPRQRHFEALADHHRQLEIWAENCPENFENRAALVGAEMARIEGRVLDAEQLYEQAIHSAQANGFVHNEALAYEVAARFYAARGFEEIAHLYLRKARYGYLRWGADGKVRQLDELYPHLSAEEPAPGPTSTIATPVEHLDLATVIKVSQAVSSEIVLEKLIHTLMRTAIEQAGAERGLLILPRGDELHIQAEATTSGEDVTVHLRSAADSTAALPESVVRYVMRTQGTVILDDASSQNPFSADHYMVQRRPRSILTLPLINQGKLISILYLENNLTPRVFTPDRITVLKVLASQAAISLENTRLYRDLEDRERRIRRLVDANILGIFMWDLEGAIVDANEAFLHMLKYGREDVASGRVRWTDLTPPKWREHDERALAELKSTGMAPAYEKEYFRKDGSRVQVLIAGALFEEGGSEGVAFALDLSELKRTEETLRKREAYLAESQRLAHTGSWAIDGTTREALYWSEEMFRIFGFDPQQGLPRRDQWLQRMHPEDREKVRQDASDRMFLQKVDADLEYRIVLPDGTVKHVRGLAHPVVSPDGELVEVLGTVADVTERKDAEEALRRSESHLAQAQRLARIGSWVFDTVRMRPVHLSTEWHRLQDFDPKDGMPTWEQRLQRIHPEDRARYGEAFNRAIAEKSDLDAEFRILLPDSTIRYIRSVGQPVLDALGEVTQMMGVIMDVTESRQAEQEHERLRQELAHLSHLNRVSTMGELTASLAHEIKQPIGAAVTNAQACLRFLDGDRLNLIEAREAASEMVLDARRAADIIDRVRSLYRKDSSHHETVDLNDLIREMIVMLRDEANRHSITTCTDLAEGLPKVMADRVQLQQALMNLMLNGIEAMRDTTGELSIRSRLAEDHQVQISVADAGVGLPIGKADQIFNAFFTTKPQGTGLGLVITRSILESHGGRVWATANAKQGTTFHFTLPIRMTVSA
jgi:PAS domain S-box-containing protein